MSNFDMVPENSLDELDLNESELGGAKEVNEEEDEEQEDHTVVHENMDDKDD